MPAPQKAAWKRLGDMLHQSRLDLDPRYDNFELFIRERDITYRVAWDIENNRRANYRPMTLHSVEVAYGWQPGSIRRVLAGGHPVLTEVDLGPAPGFVRDNLGDDIVRKLWETRRLAADAKLSLIRTYLRRRENGTGETARRRA
jgi:hypothetical protein